MSGIVIVIGIYVYDEYFFTFSHLKGTFQEGPVKSPNGTYSANVYYEPWGGAAGGVTIWVKVTTNTSKKVTKTVYYARANDDFTMKWKTDHTLKVTNKSLDYPKIDNYSVTLDVRNEIYDGYGLACKSVLMKNDYKKCLSN
ncbi:DUF5412 family protein [Pullulanibacillus sp. KACC 23026]|uniref:DUF5412 family protein n=1 Tax=Pullulanibacillus sp. KACC 23026 TaxID=3028315 RepID=UPI0023B17A4A|nr:DUF5412 family protein [Pullulanibacillus sp. KACC 23026]WEG14518.1 DUF5412 family protein [Pullulanibacillus sp. KACC 23026]